MSIDCISLTEPISLCCHVVCEVDPGSATLHVERLWRRWSWHVFVVGFSSGDCTCSRAESLQPPLRDCASESSGALGRKYIQISLAYIGRKAGVAGCQLDLATSQENLSAYYREISHADDLVGMSVRLWGQLRRLSEHEDRGRKTFKLTSHFDFLVLQLQQAILQRMRQYLSTRQRSSVMYLDRFFDEACEAWTNLEWMCKHWKGRHWLAWNSVAADLSAQSPGFQASASWAQIQKGRVKQ